MLGVNGLKIARHGDKTYLYFRNSARSVFAKVQIHPATGSVVGSPDVISTTLGAGKGVGYDSFALHYSQGCDTEPVGAFLCDFLGNAIEYVPLDKPSDRFLVAGSVDTTEVAGPSDAAFGRTAADRHILYVSTTGGILNFNATSNPLIGSQVLAVDTSSQQKLI